MEKEFKIVTCNFRRGTLILAMSENIGYTYAKLISKHSKEITKKAAEKLRERLEITGETDDKEYKRHLSERAIEEVRSMKNSYIAMAYEDYKNGKKREFF